MNSVDIPWLFDSEEFNFLGMTWDVLSAKCIVADCPREVLSLEVSDHTHLLRREEGGKTVFGVHTSLGYKEVDLSIPVIVVPRGNGFLIIDGWHRLATAEKMGVKTLPMVVLTKEESDLIKI